MIVTKTVKKYETLEEHKGQAIYFHFEGWEKISNLSRFFPTPIHVDRKKIKTALPEFKKPVGIPHLYRKLILDSNQNSLQGMPHLY